MTHYPVLVIVPDTGAEESATLDRAKTSLYRFMEDMAGERPDGTTHFDYGGVNEGRFDGHTVEPVVKLVVSDYHATTAYLMPDGAWVHPDHALPLLLTLQKTGPHVAVAMDVHDLFIEGKTAGAWRRRDG